MPAYKRNEIGRLIKALQGDASPRAVLVFGSDEGGVQEAARQLTRAILGEAAGDPMAVEELSEDILQQDPARLADEAQAISMFGGRRVVRVRGAGEHFLKAMKGIIQLPRTENLIIADAPGLKKDSALARFFCREKALACVQIYEDQGASLRQLITEVLGAHGLRAERDAELLLEQLLGADRAASRGELEKLALYCLGQARVTAEDVRAVCGDASAHYLSGMLDAWFSGDMRQGAKLFQALTEEDVPGSVMLTAAANHLAQLHELALKVAAGTPPQQVVEQARPPIFFRRKPVVIRMLRLWTPERLVRADAAIAEALAASRELAHLQDAIAERCLLRIAAQATRNARAA